MFASHDTVFPRWNFYSHSSLTNIWDKINICVIRYNHWGVIYFKITDNWNKYQDNNTSS